MSDLPVAIDQIDPVPIVQQYLDTSSHATGFTLPDAQDSLKIAIRQEGLRFGMEVGADYRNKEIKAIVAKYQIQLDDLIDFRRVIKKGNMLVPSIISGEEIEHRKGDELRRASVSHTILQKAEIVTTPPNWREYLETDWPAPEKPASVLLDKISVFPDVWQEAVSIGFQKGVEEAEFYFRNGKSRLMIDYLGRLRFLQLVSDKMLVMPDISTTNYGAVIHGDSLNIGDTVTSITKQTNWQEPEMWRPKLRLLETLSAEKGRGHEN